ncbi:uncharacterized protein LTR77_004289 [Saxophila tyrrhenica]|uniref:NmrA-like domain-containing protein n=1 Tax=Saxophila tyrrhenica TaxID=1690608 RepID=A0AAV9PFI1_9PEZI|nr:hypothetical protein LTR77_004289 [Saxophila tyrrhenica]
MSSSNYIKNVAIAGGNVGSYITHALLDTGKHTITALTRPDSSSKLPEGVNVKQIDYASPPTIVEALKGQDALVITLSGFVPKDTETKLFEAAGEAGVKWIFPNEWSPDTANENLLKDVAVFAGKPANRKAIASLGKSNYIGVSTGFWYEYSLAIGPAYGIDTVNHKATLFDDGNTKISTSTWPQVGRTVAGLLSLPIKAEGQEPCLENYANKVIYANSFTISQNEMLASVFRVTGTKESDWTIEKVGSRERYETGLEQIKEGKRAGFVKMMYTRIFFQDGAGDTEHSKGTVNAALGLPKEDLDEATKRAVARAKAVDGSQWADE